MTDLWQPRRPAREVQERDLRLSLAWLQLALRVALRCFQPVFHEVWDGRVRGRLVGRLVYKDNALRREPNRAGGGLRNGESGGVGDDELGTCALELVHELVVRVRRVGGAMRT